MPISSTSNASSTGASSTGGTSSSASGPACPEPAVGPVPAALGLDPFYARHVDVGGLPLVSSAAVSDAAFASAYYTLANLLADRPCEHEALVRLGIRIVILGRGELTLDIPEVSDLDTALPGMDWNTRTRALGPTWMRPVTIAAEENLLAEPQDPWFGENLMIHEFGHGYFEFGLMPQVDGPAWRADLDANYAAAMQAGLWANTYAATNADEYFAEAVQDWFDNNLERMPPDGVHNHVNTRAELQDYDPALAAFMSEVMTSRTFPPYCPGTGVWIDPLPATRDLSTCAFRMDQPEDRDCSLESTLVSPSGGDGVTLVAANRSFTETYTLEWLDFDGNRQPFATLGPRQQYAQSTFRGHYWLLADENGDCVKLFAASEDDTRVALE